MKIISFQYSSWKPPFWLEVYILDWFILDCCMIATIKTVKIHCYFWVFSSLLSSWTWWLSISFWTLLYFCKSLHILLWILFQLQWPNLLLLVLPTRNPLKHSIVLILLFLLNLLNQISDFLVSLLGPLLLLFDLQLHNSLLCLMCLKVP